MPSSGRKTAASVVNAVALHTVPPISVWALKAILATCHLEVREGHLFEVAETMGKPIVACWHETLGTALWYYRDRDFVTLASQSRDGELAARAAARFGFRVVRGSSSRGGLRALTELQKGLESASGLGFTLDGPKGPRRVAKAGIVVVAARSRLPIVPNAFSVRPAWRFNSWDRHAVPKPFGRIVCAYGEPVHPPPTLSPASIEATRLEVERRLNALQDALDAEA